jgi:predicted transcriptional regulator
VLPARASIDDASVAVRRVDRDVKGVHGDVHTLLNAGILRKTDDGLIIFPYDAIRVDVILHAA